MVDVISALGYAWIGTKLGYHFKIKLGLVKSIIRPTRRFMLSGYGVMVTRYGCIIEKSTLYTLKMINAMVSMEDVPSWVLGSYLHFFLF